MQCAIQVMGLVRGEPKPGAKHRANGSKICLEAGTERHSRSETLDRSRSHLNDYSGGESSGAAAWAAMQARADAYRITGTFASGKRAGEQYSRALRADAVVGWSLIINPPAAATAGWTKADYDKFYADSLKVLGKIEPRLFKKPSVRMTAVHHDEGLEDVPGEFSKHKHIIGDAVDEQGRYCGNIIDAALMVRINLEYPKLMRQLGHDVEDVDQTDFHRMGKNEDGTYRDPEYRAERLAKAKAKKNGMSVNEYLDYLAEEGEKLALEHVAKAEEAQRAAEAAQRAAEALRAKAEEEAAQTLKAAQRAAEREREAIVAAARKEAEQIKATAQPVTPVERQLLDVAKRLKIIVRSQDGRQEQVTMYTRLTRAARAEGIRAPEQPAPQRSYGRNVDDLPDL